MRTMILTARPASARARSARVAHAAGSARVPRTSSIGEAASATRSANVSASARGAVTSTGRGEAEPNDARNSSPAETASDTTAITIALRGPTFMNVCGARDGVTQTAVISSSPAESVAFDAGDELAERHSSRAANRFALDLGVLDERAAAVHRPPARRCRGCRRSCRGFGSAATRRCAKPRRAPAARRGAARARPRRRSDRSRVGAVRRCTREAAELGDLVQIQQRRGPAVVEVERHHHVRAALDRPGGRDARPSAAEPRRACGASGLPRGRRVRFCRRGLHPFHAGSRWRAATSPPTS